MIAIRTLLSSNGFVSTHIGSVIDVDAPVATSLTLLSFWRTGIELKSTCCATSICPVRSAARRDVASWITKSSMHGAFGIPFCQ